MAWVDFLICLFFGMLGVHKFKEKKIGMGILYLCTAGLFYVGWISDCIKYGKAAFNSVNAERAIQVASDNITSENVKKATPIIKLIVLWCLFVALVVLALPFITSVSGFLFAMAALLVLPAKVWRDFLDKYINGKVKVVAVIVLIVAAFVMVPAAEISNDYNDYPGNSWDETINSTSQPTTLSTTEPTSLPTTVPTTEPITVPTTVPTMPIETTLAPTEHKHSFADATCTTPKTCTTCGATTGATSEHSYSKGKCVVCAAEDPNYVVITYVLNVDSMKFHRTSCGRLPTNNRQDTTMSREEIIEKGYTPCGICHP